MCIFVASLAEMLLILYTLPLAVSESVGFCQSFHMLPLTQLAFIVIICVVLYVCYVYVYLGCVNCVCDIKCRPLSVNAKRKIINLVAALVLGCLFFIYNPSFIFYLPSFVYLQTLQPLTGHICTANM